MTVDRAGIDIEFQSFWTAGTGGGRGRHLDAVCHRDEQGFPAMPSSQVRGTLRETAERLAKSRLLGWTDAMVDKVFGSRTENGGRGKPGGLQFSGDFEVGDTVRSPFAGRQELLFERIAATRINEDGVAEDKTLRYIEAAVPLTLTTFIEWGAKDVPPENWVALLDAVAAATLAFGKAKNDGYGRAIASVASAAPLVNAQAEIIQEILEADRVILLLEQTQPAIFSEKSATEAAHRTVSAPTGASLLGWCAAKGAYDDFEDPFAVFHTGRVQFGDAAPISKDGGLSVPFPRNLFAPKGAEIRTPEGHLILDQIHVGAPPQDQAGDTQFEAIKGDYLSGAATIVKSVKGQRLRTATDQGRAARSQLFGFQHLSPLGNPRYAAEVSRDATIGSADWGRVLKAFHGRTLRLGRARSAGFGGEFICSVVLPPSGNFASLSLPAADRVRVLALSDLALIDDRGSPTNRPKPSEFGLSDAWVFDARDSVIATRRIVPWNGQLRGRDMERLTISAGSVLSFSRRKEIKGVPPVVGRSVVGAHREIGYGQVWINPAFMAGDVLPADFSFRSIVAPGSDSRTGPKGDERDETKLRQWSERRVLLVEGAPA